MTISGIKLTPDGDGFGWTSGAQQLDFHFDFYNDMDASDGYVLFIFNSTKHGKDSFVDDYFADTLQDCVKYARDLTRNELGI